MSRKPITVEPDTLVEDAASIMLKKNISCLPVVSPSENIEGILSWKDILKFYIERDDELQQVHEFLIQIGDDSVQIGAKVFGLRCAIGKGDKQK